MRDLNLFRNISIEDSFLTKLKKCLVLTESSTLKSTRLILLNEYTEVYQLNITENFSFENIFVTDLAQFVDEPTFTVTVAGCNFIYNELYVILSNGYLITTVIVNDDSENDSLGQSLNVGPTKIASWSPDFERTVLINSEDQLFILNIVNTDFEILHELSLQDVDEELNKLVNVGWGSVETQFRGSEGKFSKTVSQEVAQDVLEDIFDDSIHISWKQNGSAFAVNYVCRAERNRKVKVFNQDGALLNVTKNINGLGSPIDWCPSRNLIFCPQLLPNKQVICFLEENTLRHGEFEISQDIKTKELLWNTSGTILALHGVSDDCESIILFTTSNYKWYTKQHLQFKDDSVLFMQWDFLSANRLHVVLKSGVYRSYEWTFQVDESSKNGNEANKAIVAVVNGHQLGVTPCSLVNQPPSLPFKIYDLSPNQINAVVFPERYFGSAIDFDCNSAIVYLNNDSLRLLKYEEEVGAELRFSFENKTVEFSTPSELSTFLWLLPDKLFFSWCKTDGYYLCVSHLDITNQTVVVKKMFKMESTILSACSYHEDVIVHLDNGRLFLYRDENLCSMDLSFVEPCIRLQLLDENTLIALSENRNLYINESIRFRDIVSFYWKAPFVILLSMDSHLLISKVNFNEKSVCFDEVLSRSVESKSYLITIVDDRVLLEMERGNLETIVPRPFTIFQMEEKLKNGDYFEAFKMLRKQRINLNVLYDHDPNNFMKNIKDIIRCVADPSYLLNFITELQDHNVAISMFPWKYKSDQKSAPNKIITICESLCAALKDMEDPIMIVPLIAALVKLNKLSEAVKYAKEYDEVSTLNHLCDPVDVYKACLRSFDLKSALYIIQHSKLDPSEYLPFINELQAMDENYKKFKICDYLEDYPAAVKHLADCSEDEKFEEFLIYMNKHQLFRSALEIFSVKMKESEGLRSKYKQVLTSVAEYYFENQCFQDAGILFEKANLYDRALKCYISLGDWFSAMSVAECMQTEAKNLLLIGQELYDELMKQRKYNDAGFVAYNFLSDCKLTINAYMIGAKYCNAINAAKKLKSEDIISQYIRPRLVNEAKLLISQQNTKLVTLTEYQERLLKIREKKKISNENNYEDDRQSVVSSSDSSDASSILSSSSKISSASSSAKRARRRERRLWNLKPGNRREEPSLLNAIRQAVIDYENCYNEIIPDLIKALVKTDELILARELKENLEQFHSSLKKIIDRTWIEGDLPEEGAGFRDILTLCPPDIGVFRNNLVIFNCN